MEKDLIVWQTQSMGTERAYQLHKCVYPNCHSVKKVSRAYLPMSAQIACVLLQSL